MDPAARCRRTFEGMRCEHRALIVAGLLLAGPACRKDGDDSPPSVSITAPGTSYVLVMPDTLTVVASVSDDERIERVTVSLVDANGQPVGGPVTVEPSSNPATVSVDLPVTSDLVESGEHLLKVVASDGTGRGQDEQVLEVVAIPRRTRAVHLIATPGFSPVQVLRIDSTGQLEASPMATLAQDIAPSAVSSKGRRLYIGAGVGGQLTALFPDNGSITAQASVQNTLPIPFHTALHVGPTGRLFAATNEGELRRYGTDLQGSGYVAQALPSHRIVGIVETGQAVLTTQSRYISPAGHSLARYSTTSGVQQDAWVLDKAPVAFFARDPDHVLLFGNRNGQGVVEDRNIDGGGYWEPRIFPDPVLAVAMIDANNYIVSTGGTLQRFTYNNAGALTIATGIMAEVLAYDEVNGVLLAAEGGVVKAIDPGNGTVLATYAAGAAVVNILPLYSR